MQHPLEHLAQRRRDRDVEGGHRLVEQQYVGLRGECPGDRDPLRLAARQLGRPPRGQVRGVDQLEPARRRTRGFLLRQATGARTERHVVAYVEVREQQRVLGEQRHAPRVGGDERSGPAGPDVGQHPSRQLDPAAVRSQQPRDQVQHRRLARAVGAEQRDHLGVADLDRHLDVPLAHLGVHDEGHVARPRTSPITSTATTTSTSDSATAASGSVSRCR